MCTTSFSTLYTSLEIHLWCQICLTSLWHHIKNLPLFCRFCICTLHEQFSCWLQTLHKIILAHHDDNCECDCGFCISCGDIDNISIGTCYAHLHFAFMALPFLFLTGNVSRTSTCFYFMLVYTTFIFFRFLNRCNLCHSNKLESLFECPVTRLLYDEWEVDY